MSLPEQMTATEYAEVMAQALIEREDYGRIQSETLEKLRKIRDKETVVMHEGWVRPLRDHDAAPHAGCYADARRICLISMSGDPACPGWKPKEEDEA